jgi:hypothetical protein
MDALNVALHATALRKLGRADGALERLQLHVGDQVGLKLRGEAEPPSAHLAVVPGRLTRGLHIKQGAFIFFFNKVSAILY